MNKDRNEKLRRRILELYESRGLKIAVEKCDELLKDSGRGSAKLSEEERRRALAEFRGELAEVVLEVIVRDYVKNNKGSFYIKNLVVPKIEDPTHFNELDLTLFTEGMVFLFECKSYNVDKVLTGDCTIEMEGRDSQDIYKQNFAHLKTFHEHLKSFKKSTGIGYKLIFFDYSLDKYSVTDKRGDKEKSKMILTNKNTINKIINENAKNQSMWEIADMSEYLRPISNSSEKNMKIHLENIKSYA